VRFSGATVHFVSAEVDMGPIILQAVVPVMQDDTEETLAARILVEEHKIYPESVRLFFEGKLEVRGRCVFIL
jgi:phosphoribosylglycinamide formyltransferase-1